MTYRDLLYRLNDQPFKPFRIKLINNTIYDINKPWMASPGRSSAVIAVRSTVDAEGVRVADEWKTVSIAHMLEFSDLEIKRNGNQPRKRK